jgi:hypothetical protein
MGWNMWQKPGLRKWPWCLFKEPLKFLVFPNGAIIFAILHRKQKEGFCRLIKNRAGSEKEKRSPIRAYFT